MLLLLPALPGIGADVNGARLWVQRRPAPVPAGRARQDLLIVFLAGYLREKREVLAQGRLKDFGPLLVIWGAAMLVLVETNDLGSALLYFGIFLAMLYVATGAAALRRDRARALPRRRLGVYQTSAHVRERVTIWLHPWTDHAVYCALTGKPRCARTARATSS